MNTPEELLRQDYRSLRSMLERRPGRWNLFDILWKHKDEKEGLTGRTIVMEKRAHNRTEASVQQNARILRKELRAYNEASAQSGVEHHVITLPLAKRGTPYKLKIHGPVSNEMPTEEQTPDNHILDDEFLKDPLSRLCLAESWGLPDQLSRIIREEEEWLRKYPNDVYRRAALFWLVLRTGCLSQMVQAVKQLAQWLDTNSELDIYVSQTWDSKLASLKNKTLEFGELEQRYIEETLVRASMLRWLKKGRFFESTARITACRHTLEKPYAKNLIRTVDHAPNWLLAAFDQAADLVFKNPEEGLLQICLLWFAARLKDGQKISSLVGKSFLWLRGHDDALLRMITVWLTTLSEDISQRTSVIEQSRDWMARCRRHEDECLTAMPWFWLVATDAEQSQRAIRDTGKWFEDNPKNDFIRIAYLLTLIRRKATAKERKSAIKQTIRHRRDADPLVSVALRLLEASTA